MGFQMTILFLIPLKQGILVQRPIPLGPWRSVNDRMGQNKLHMHPSKMEYISFASKTMIKRITITSITVCNDTVIYSPCIKLLGSYLDQSFTMSTHITKKYSLAMWNLSHIQSIKTTWILIPSRPLFRPYACHILTTAMHCSTVFPQKILIISNVFKIPVQN